ncbi:MAG: hypothetical protein GXP49_15390 [Deltaproteobacteria bacterium]|nr:hypothetical protein [Deltaproteobacteria bacterium]
MKRGSTNHRSPCPGLWLTPVIRHDGELHVCCADVEGEIKVGNLKDADFDELWFGSRMNEYRAWHLRGEFHKMPKCETCGGINFYKLDKEQIKNWCMENNEMDALEAFQERTGGD